MEALVGLDAQEDDVSIVAQAAEEFEDEADVAILDGKLRLVEQVAEGACPLRPLQHPRHARLVESPNLVGLVIVDGEPIALGVANTVDVAAVHEHAPLAWRIAAGD